MRWQEIIEYTTKSGQEIDFKYHEDIEGDNNRGWIVHQIDAYVDGKYAGYLKIAYIPKERFKKWYPTILNYMSMIGGKTGLLPFKKEYVDYHNLTNEELSETLQRLAYQSHKYNDIWRTGGKEGMPTSKEGKIAIIEDIIRNELDEDWKRFKEFKEYFVDRPYVDFIRVFKKDEPTGKELDSNKAEKEFRRQGIGTALYLEGAKFLKDKGLMLRASTGQSDEAKKTWNALEKKGYVKQIGKSRYIDPNKI